MAFEEGPTYRIYPEAEGDDSAFKVGFIDGFRSQVLARVLVDVEKPSVEVIAEGGTAKDPDFVAGVADSIIAGLELEAAEVIHTIPEAAPQTSPVRLRVVGSGDKSLAA